jgi:hypothetical protein
LQGQDIGILFDDLPCERDRPDAEVDLVEMGDDSRCLQDQPDGVVLAEQRFAPR